MSGTKDFLYLDYTQDLTLAGIAYACRSLAFTYDRMGGSPFERLRRIAAGVAVELAFRRCLGERAVPFDVLGATPFTDPDRYDVSLGGHRCDLKSFLITRREQISDVRRDPGLVLQAPALVPLDQFAGEGHSGRDLYLFAFCLALMASSNQDVRRAEEARQPVYLIHPLPGEWSKPGPWLPLEGLAFKSECLRPVRLEIGGQDAERNFVTASLELSSKTRRAVEPTFYSLAYIHAGRQPEARIGLHCPRRGEAYLIQPHEWGDIWVYGMDILLAGYLTREEFRRKAQLIPAGSPTFQYARTRTKNLAVKVEELHPLGELFERVKSQAGDNFLN